MSIACATLACSSIAPITILPPPFRAHLPLPRPLDPIFGQALRLFDIERRSLKEAAEIVSISLTGGEDLDKKEHQLFGEDGLESMVDRVASIENMLGIYELAKFTPRI